MQRSVNFLIAAMAVTFLAAAGNATAQEPGKPAGKPVNRIGAHVGIVVRDVEKTARAFADLFGLQMPKIGMSQPSETSHMRFHGEPSEARAKLAFLKVNDIAIELIEPVGGPSTWREFLDQKGEGVHHIAFTAEGDEDVARLEEKGGKLVQKGNFGGGGGYSYVDLTQQLGVIVELLRFPKEP